MRPPRARGATATRPAEPLPQPGEWCPRILRRLACVTLAALSLALLPTTAQAAAQTAAQDKDSLSAPSVPARTWAVDCANKELLVLQPAGTYLRYRTHDVNEKGDRVRDQIETPEGSVARLILRDGKPLTAEEDAAERERLKALLASPSAFAHHIREERSNRKMGTDLLKLMPDAMLWSYAPDQPQLSSQTAGAPPLVVLDFKPNPKWSSPSLEADTLTGLEGRVWIDPRTRSMVSIQSDLLHAVNFGWGMLAHIYPGGTIAMTQANPAGDRWIVNHIVYQFNARALMVKSVKQHSTFDASGFQSVPDMTYQQAIKTLLDTPLPTH